MISVAIIEDDDPLRAAFTAILHGTDGFRCAGDYRSAEAAIAKIPALQPDVVLVDLLLPRTSGIECIRELKDRCLQTQFVALTVDQSPEAIFAALEAGASGYLLKRKSPAQILEAIEEVHHGGAPMSAAVARLIVQRFHQRGKQRRPAETLSPREQQVLELVTQGQVNKEIAASLGLRDSTVSAHLRRIYEKLHVHSRTEAAMRFIRP